jgi:hypothetical protein
VTVAEGSAAPPLEEDADIALGNFVSCWRVRCIMVDVDVDVNVCVCSSWC